MRGKHPPRVDATELARNHWHFILTQLGIPEKSLTGNHGPCPACGGEDRFRFDNRNGEGSHFCSGCGAGSGYQLLQKVKGWQFKQAFEEVQRLVGEAPDEEEQVRAEMSPARKKAIIREAWSAGAFGAAETIQYLQSRGLSGDMAAYAADLLRYGRIYHTDFDSPMPAIMALIQDVNGRAVSLHRTYLLTEDSWDKRTMPAIRPISGCAIRLSMTIPDKLVVAEGIETTLAAMEMMDLPGWATISAHGMESLELPPQVKQVVVCGDNDAKYAGQKAAYTLAHRLACKMGDENVEVVLPTFQGTDFMDVLAAKKKAGT